MSTAKDTMRRRIREMKRQFTGEQLDELSLHVMSRLLAHPAVAAAKTILMYYSLPDEVNTHDAVNQLVQAGKTVLLPRVTDGENMEIRRYHNAGDLVPGSYGIMEPTGEAYTNYVDIDVAVVPGMAFDAQGHRLGRGKGYYDRFLPKAAKAYKIGVCFDFQKQETIPTDDNDVTMDYVI